MATLNLVHILYFMLTLAAAVSSFKIQARHDGIAHRHKELDRREDTQNGPVSGIGVILPPELPKFPPTNVNSGLTSMTKPVVVLSSDTQVSSLPSYSFTPTVIQVPVATVCPETASTKGVFSILPVSSSLLAPVVNSTNYEAVSRTTINVTALLPNGSTTVFLSSTSTSTSQSPVISDAHPTARIVLDLNGCQTIFTPITTAICDTTVQLVGIPSVSVTDCNQWITFSSETNHDCDTSRSTISATQKHPAQNEQAAEEISLTQNAAFQSPSPTSAAEYTVKSKGKIEPIAVGEPYPSQQPQSTTRTLSPSSEIQSEASSKTDLSLIAPVPIDSTGTFYLAHWTDLLSHGVPTLVRVEDCAALPAPTVGVDCTTTSENWSVTRATRTLFMSSVIAFSGPATLTMPPVSPRTQTITVTTTLSLNSTQTMLTTSVTASVVRRRITSPFPLSSSLSSSSSSGVTAAVPLATDEDEEEATSTPHVTVPTTRVIDLEEVTETTTQTVRRTRTEVRTRIQTRTRNGGVAGTGVETGLVAGAG